MCTHPEKDLFLLIATSPSFFKQAIDKDRPLYELFRVELLEELEFVPEIVFTTINLGAFVQQ